MCIRDRATRVQQMSSLFRQKQSHYLRKLQGMEVQERSDSSLLDSVQSVQEDVALVRDVYLHLFADQPV